MRRERLDRLLQAADDLRVIRLALETLCAEGRLLRGDVRTLEARLTQAEEGIVRVNRRMDALRQPAGAAADSRLFD